jgi:ATP-dependent helicase/nuclease subunit A
MSVLSDHDARERAITEPQNFVVTAGAGTGKTSVLVERALHLVLSGRLGIERVAAITFTEKAAAELKRRLATALTETLARLDGHRSSPVGEADRALERLRGAGHPDGTLKDRARTALEYLDAAFIGTLHALAADILRRHAMAAHLPPDFAVEDELSGGLLFEEAWTRFLGNELGHNGTRGELWARVLRRLTETDIERAAFSLHQNPAAADLLAIEGYRPLIPDSELDLRVRELLLRVTEYTAEFERVPPSKRNKNFPVFLEIVRSLLEAYLAGGPDALDLVDVSRVNDFWERKDPYKAGTPNADEMESTAMRAFRLLGQLRRVDEALIRDLLDVLQPFAESVREHVRREGVLTYDDLLVLARDLLRDVPAVRDQERSRFDAILVDEFQDTDPIQYDIVFFLCGGDAVLGDPYARPLEPNRLFIVGDPKQSIYRFRGADMGAYDRAVRHALANGERISLLTSYRSRPEVLKCLNTLFRNWIGKIADRAIEPEYEEILASRDAGGQDPGVEIWSIVALDDAEIGARRAAEAKEIAGRIREWLEAGRSRPGDIAVLFRALTDAPIYMRALREAGIEFVLEGGRAFFERPEIVEAFALLGAIANPADPVSLIGVLRTGFGGATDQELAAHANLGEPWRWKSATEGRDAVHDTYARLRTLDRTRDTMPLDRWIEWVLVESAFALTQAAHLDGPQRVANLRKLAQKAGTLVRDRGLTLEECLRVLSDAFAGERVEGESPLADEGLNVVRLTTIHKAKGLEFGIVIVPDLARRTQEPYKGTRVSRYTHQGESYLAVEVADRERTRNLAEVARQDGQRTHDEAEAKRLLYVATTRARDRVILVNSATSSRVAWMQGLAQIGYVLEDKTYPPEGWLADTGIWHRVCHESANVSPARNVDSAPVVDAYDAFVKAAAIASRPAPARFRNPSLDHLLAATDKDEALDPGLTLYAPDLARAVGVAVHRILEAWPFVDGHDWRAFLPPVIERTARELGLSRIEDLERETSLVLDAFARSSLLSYLRQVEILGREVPILWRDPEGATVIGYADLIYRADGHVHVADYKTDTDVSPSHAAQYRPQLVDYAQAVQAALGLASPPITEILFIRAGTRISV